MAQFRHSTHSVTLEAGYDMAFDYLSDWRKLPEWGVSFVKGIREEDGQIIMTTPFGDVPVTFRNIRELGVLDVIFPGDSVGPGRLTQIGDTCVYTFTFSVPAETPDEEFAKNQRNMEEELEALKRIVEGRSA